MTKLIVNYIFITLIKQKYDQLLSLLSLSRRKILDFFFNYITNFSYIFLSLVRIEKFFINHTYRFLSFFSQFPIELKGFFINWLFIYYSHWLLKARYIIFRDLIFLLHLFIYKQHVFSPILQIKYYIIMVDHIFSKIYA